MYDHTPCHKRIPAQWRRPINRLVLQAILAILVPLAALWAACAYSDLMDRHYKAASAVREAEHDRLIALIASSTVKRFKITVTEY